jgi:hypothetical protein
MPAAPTLCGTLPIALNLAISFVKRLLLGMGLTQALRRLRLAIVLPTR